MRKLVCDPVDGFATGVWMGCYVDRFGPRPGGRPRQRRGEPQVIDMDRITSGAPGQPGALR
jgi:hypothetical protein